MRNSISVFLLGCLLLTPVSTYAAGADSCRATINKEISREHRLYRAYLFGKRNAKDAALGNVRYDKDGWAWMKTTSSSTPWRNSHPDNQGLQWSNTVMDENDEHADILPLVGIFETKRVNTSELIPYALHTIRSFDCRLQTLCEVARISEIQTEDTAVDIERIQPLGCIEYTDLHTWPSCHFGTPGASVLDQSDERGYCDDVSNQLLRREVEMLKLAVEYDAGYRSLLQLAGNFDIFLGELRWPLTGTIRQAANLIGQLERVPCFLSSCDASPPIAQ